MTLHHSGLFHQLVGLGVWQNENVATIVHIADMRVGRFVAASIVTHTDWYIGGINTDSARRIKKVPFSIAFDDIVVDINIRTLLIGIDGAFIVGARFQCDFIDVVTSMRRPLSLKWLSE